MDAVVRETTTGRREVVVQPEVEQGRTHLLREDLADALEEVDVIVVRLDENVELGEVVVRRLRDLVEVDEEGRARGRCGREDEVGEEDGVVRNVGAAQVEEPCEEEELVSDRPSRRGLGKEASAQAISSSWVTTRPQQRLSPVLALASPPKTSCLSSSARTRAILLLAPSPACSSPRTKTSSFGRAGLPCSPPLSSRASTSHTTSTRLSRTGTSSTPALARAGARVV